MIDLVSLVAAFLISIVFFYTASTKFLSLETFSASVKQFGSPKSLVGPVTLAVPTIEMLIAMGLLFPNLVLPSSFAGIVILAVFSLLIFSLIRQGIRPICACFGSISAKPISHWSLARNAFLVSLLAIVAATNLTGHFTSLTHSVMEASPSPMTSAISHIALILTIVLLAAIIFELAPRAAALASQQGARAKTAIQSKMPPLTQFPDLVLPSADGSKRRLSELYDNSPELAILFVSGNCDLCEGAAIKIPQWQTDYPGRSFVVAHREPRNTKIVRLDVLALSHIVHDATGELFETADIKTVPAIVLLDAAGKASTSVASGTEQIQQFWKSGVAV